jgi:hypothetical protein
VRYNHSRRKPQPPAGARQFQQEQLRAAQHPSLAATSGSQMPPGIVRKVATRISPQGVCSLRLSSQGDPVKAALLHHLPFNYLLLGNLCKGSPARRAPSDACHKGSLLTILSILSSPVVPSTVDGHGVRKPALGNENSYKQYKRAFRNRALRTKAHKGLPTQEPFLTG